MRQQWEYQTLVVDWAAAHGPVRGQSLQALLNEHGRKGWELVSVAPETSLFGTDSYVLFLRRQKEAAGPE